eukprot:1815457-Rhodomonas_salina.1
MSSGVYNIDPARPIFGICFHGPPVQRVSQLGAGDARFIAHGPRPCAYPGTGLRELEFLHLWSCAIGGYRGCARKFCEHISCACAHREIEQNCQKWAGLVPTPPQARDPPIATTLVQTPIPAHFSISDNRRHGPPR